MLITKTIKNSAIHIHYLLIEETKGKAIIFDGDLVYSKKY